MVMLLAGQRTGLQRADCLAGDLLSSIISGHGIGFIRGTFDVIAVSHPLVAQAIDIVCIDQSGRERAITIENHHQSSRQSRFSIGSRQGRCTGRGHCVSIVCFIQLSITVLPADKNFFSGKRRRSRERDLIRRIELTRVFSIGSNSCDCGAGNVPSPANAIFTILGVKAQGHIKVAFQRPALHTNISNRKIGTQCARYIASI